ncbi:MAG: FAD binding domain-containing protein [Candidatus Sericytochromatia bacterium]
MFYQPTTVAEALELKSRLGAEARFLAGGTDLVVQAEKGRFQFDKVVDISRLTELTGTRDEGDWLYVGAGCPHRALERWDVLVLAAAARTVGGPQIRNRGTVGGNVANASPAGDVSVALLALDAQVDLVSVRGTRSMPLHEFFVHVGRTAIAPDELIMGFRFRRPAASAFYKVGKRTAVAISVVCAGISITPEGHPVIALGSVAPTPKRLFETEAYLREHGLTPTTIEVASRLASEEVTPITDHRASGDYRRALAGSLVSRLLSQLT